MRIKSQLQQAWLNIAAAKLRSFLALLGILVGTAAVVALLSCGRMATEKALEQFRALGTDLLAVSAFNRGHQPAKGADMDINLAAWRRLPDIIPSIKKIAPYATTYQSISFAGKELQGPIIGADESLADIIQIDMARGRFVSFLNTSEHVAVIGSAVAQKMRSVTLDDPIGQQLVLGKGSYTIIGVANAWKENAFFNEDINRAIIVPVAGVQYINKTSKINSAVVLLEEDTPIAPTMESIRFFLGQQAPGLHIFMRSAQQIIHSMESQGKIFTLLLAVIGGISLLVGGIGVMNVMLVAVSERKKEIGIRKAVGARNRDIKQLFLIEAAAVAVIGGIMGVLLGIAFSFVVARFSQWSFFVGVLPPTVGFGISVATGIFFGFYPAVRAANLPAIVSLRGD